MDGMDRREFGALLPALLLFGAGDAAGAQTKVGSLAVIESGVFQPGVEHAAGPQRVSRPYLKGLLKAGGVQLEMHETTQEVGAPHEPVGTHLHNEFWLVREGTVELTTNGVARRMVAGDVGICVAGDKHYIQNVGSTRATYFVVTVGPVETA